MTQVFFRGSRDTRDEEQVCRTYFRTATFRNGLTAGSAEHPEPVICRFSALPFPRELEQDLGALHLKPINSAFEQSLIGDFSWYPHIAQYTFPTWFRLEDVPTSAFPIVVKGRTNSRKFEWDTLMFAPDRATAARIAATLMQDPLIGQQGLVFRKYIPLERFETGLHGLPFTNEWRCFFYRGDLVATGYYWANTEETSRADTARPEFLNEGLALAQTTANVLCEEIAPFLAIDVAKTETGRWIVVEVNDGQMAGLSCIEPDLFYGKLALLTLAR